MGKGNEAEIEVRELTARARLFGIEREVCKTIVDRLVTTSYLKWTHAGAFTRATR